MWCEDDSTRDAAILLWSNCHQIIHQWITSVSKYLFNEAEVGNKATWSKVTNFHILDAMWLVNILVQAWDNGWGQIHRSPAVCFIGLWLAGSEWKLHDFFWWVKSLCQEESGSLHAYHHFILRYWSSAFADMECANS